MIDAIRIIAERKIAEAIREGSFNTTALHGKPLPEENNGHVPADLRMAYKILKNAGFLPPEIETRKEIHQIQELLAVTSDEHVRLKQLKKLEVLLRKLSDQRQRPVNLEVDAEYYRKVAAKITVG
ncbi:MAG: hypothetical protein A2521_07355 [Deltaproteobacteria bacterium RIFOXYD12_FULL_57_12]|nr:MAG: hypothetical protein A2521_07355 [Deltaproteobacteria bacterium RIFOXYD12_FULL_57_12]